MTDRFYKELSAALLALAILAYFFLHPYFVAKEKEREEEKARLEEIISTTNHYKDIQRFDQIEALLTQPKNIHE